MSQSGANSNTGSGGLVVETFTGNSGGPVGPDAAFNIDLLGNNTMGIDVVGTPASNLLTIVGIQATTSQIGVTEYATAIETGQLSDTDKAITPDSLGPILTTEYVVDSGGAYTTIQSAIDAANAAGGGIVYVRPGSYAENLTLYDNIQIIAGGFSDTGAGVEITGTHTPPSSGGIVIRNCKLISATDVFSSAVAGSTHILVADAAVEVTNGFLYNLPNWTGTLESWDVNCADGTNDGFVNNTGGSTILCYSGGFGVGTGNTMVVSGPIFTDGAEFFCPIDFQAGSVLGIVVATFYESITFSNNTTGYISTSDFIPTSGSAITMSSSADINISNSAINSSTNPAIAGSGAGTLTLTDISFLKNASLAGTLTLGSSSVYPVDMADGELLIGSAGQPAVASTLTAGSNISIANGAGSITISANGGGELAITSIDDTDSPYTVLSTDEYLSCDVSGGVLTVELPNAPTTGRIVTVKDSGGDAASQNITVTTVGGVVTIDGSTSYTMNTNYQSARFIFNGSSYEIF